MSPHCSNLLLLPFVVVALSLSAAEKAKKTPKATAPEVPAFTTRASAGPDFLAQGEYEGRTGSGKLGANVIASAAFINTTHQR